MTRGTRVGGLLLLATIGCTAGCIPSLTMLQRAETEPRGAASFSASVGGYALPKETGGAGTVVVVVPNLELAGRIGLEAGVDLGLKVWTDAPGVMADVKVELVHTPRLVLSADPGAGLSLFGQVATAGGAGTAGSAQLYLPLILGVRLGADELVISPRVIGWYAEVGSQSTLLWLGSGAVGVDLAAGPIHLMPEVDLACEIGGARGAMPCFGYLAMSLRYR